MNPHHVYKSQTTVGWTRVDMLLALYEQAIRHLQCAQEEYRSDNVLVARRECLRALRVVAQLQYGLDTSYGEVALNLGRLFDYAQQCLTASSASKVDSALRVLTTLRDAFAEIRTEAIQLESEGIIPPLQNLPSFDTIT